jgi:hypothetical protein
VNRPLLLANYSDIIMVRERQLSRDLQFNTPYSRRFYGAKDLTVVLPAGNASNKETHSYKPYS